MGVQQKNNKVKFSEIIDGKNKAEEIIEIFSSKFLKFDMDENIQEEEEFLNELRILWDNERKFYPRVSAERLRELIRRLNIGEGHDKIHTIFLRNMSEKLLQLLSLFMSSSYSHCYVPVKLLNGDINPTIKDAKGNVTESANYRPVMQSSNLLKLFEIHMLDIISEKIDFSSRQFGFRKYTSTTDACLLLKETVNQYIVKKGEKVYGLFVDLSKAFDRVDHILMGKILLKRKLPPDIILFLMHYMRNQKARIVWKGIFGEYIHIEKGVRQGGILSPFLFKLYIDDILLEICNSNIGCSLGIMRLNVLAYADDIVLLGNTVEQLETLYGILKSGMEQCKLTINKIKTKCMVFSKHPFDTPSNICLQNDNFEIVFEYKYLGHVIQYNLSDIKDVSFRLNSFYGKFHWVFRNFKNIAPDVLFFLFKSFCMSEYGLTIWNLGDILNKQCFKTFKVAYSNALKKIVDVPVSTSSHAVAEVLDNLLFHHLLTFIQIRYFKRVLKSFNPILKMLFINIKNGYLYGNLSKRVKDTYGCDIMLNALDVLRSRIFWVQNHEPHTGHSITAGR